MTKHKTYDEAGFNIASWGHSGVAPTTSFLDAKALDAKAETLWDATREAYSLKDDDACPALRAYCNLNRYGRSLKNMFACTENHQPSSLTMSLTRTFIHNFADEFDLERHTCLQIVDETLGRWRFLT